MTALPAPWNSPPRAPSGTAPASLPSPSAGCWSAIPRASLTLRPCSAPTQRQTRPKFWSGSCCAGKQLEVAFQEARTHLGMETQRQWSEPGHRPHHAHPAGPLLLDHPGRSCLATRASHHPAHRRLVPQTVADLRGCHRTGATPPVAGLGGLLTVSRRP